MVLSPQCKKKKSHKQSTGCFKMQMNYALAGELGRGKVPWKSFPGCQKYFSLKLLRMGNSALTEKNRLLCIIRNPKSVPLPPEFYPKTKLLSMIATLPSLLCPLPRFKVCIDLIVHSWQAASQRERERERKRKVTLWRALGLGEKLLSFTIWAAVWQRICFIGMGSEVYKQSSWSFNGCSGDLSHLKSHGSEEAPSSWALVFLSYEIL